MINRAFAMIWYFVGVYIINRTLNGRLEVQNFSSRVEKYFTRSQRSLVRYFSTIEEKFRTPRGHVISSINKSRQALLTQLTVYF